MAEIRVEKKSPMWPWILIGIIILGIILYFVVFQDSGDDPDRDGTAVTEQTDDDRFRRDGPVNNQTVASFVTFVQEGDREMSLDHEYSNEALKRLTDATKAMADEVNVDVERDLSVVREHARAIQEDPFETTHADKIKASAEKISDALMSIQREAFPNLSSEAGAVKNSATQINSEELALEQREEIKSFYDRAAALLRQMNS
ncbi:hypothetical protein [Anditalea andensis]|uniref:Uncharacterized protein n=1 Tax=Anditalea andensis TaxID=1048983 RepID=A0A074KPS2_9BACT|nr:hypothetical protein [Anditalea andensis]KEO71956.1 hypothetical protein EL17_20795 [Anditalea andensis]